MGRFAIGLSLALAIAVAPLVTAAETAADAAAPAQKAAKPKTHQKLICKEVQGADVGYEGGSRLGGERQCLTQAQWDERSAQDSEALRHGTPMSGN